MPRFAVRRSQRNPFSDLVPPTAMPSDDQTQRYVQVVLDAFDDDTFKELVSVCEDFQDDHDRSKGAFNSRSEALQRRGWLKRELKSVRVQSDSSLRLKYDHELERIEHWLEQHEDDSPGFDATRRREALEERIKGFFSDRQLMTEFDIARFIKLVKQARYERIFRNFASQAGGWTRLADLRDGFNDVTIIFEVDKKTDEKSNKSENSRPWHFVKYDVKDPSGYRSLILWDASIRRLQPGYAYALTGVKQELYDSDDQITRTTYSRWQDLGPVRE